MKKNIPSIAKEMMKATIVAPRKSRLRRNSNWTIGALTRRSTQKKVASRITEAAINPRMRGEPQPQSLPSISASTPEVSPAVSTAVPAQSI